MKLNIGSRVRSIATYNEAEYEPRFCLPTGSLGTVLDISNTTLLVKWDNPTKGGVDTFWCVFEEVEEVYHYLVEVLIGHFRFSRNCDTAEMSLEALNCIFEAMPNTKRNDVDFKEILAEMESGKRISYNECPIAICRIKGECE